MKPHFVLVFIVLCLLILGGISFLIPEGGIKLSEDLKIKYPTAEELFQPKKVESRRLAEVAKFRTDSIKYALKVSDSLSFEDSLAIYSSFDNNNPAKLHYPNQDKTVLYSFFKYLDSLENMDTSLHILHYGDSQIEMDRITGYLREKLQEKFGGFGVGMLSPRPLTPTYNISLSYSQNWRRKVPFGPKSHRAKSWRYGPVFSVCSFDSAQNATVTVRSKKRSTERVKKFNKARVLYRGKLNVSASAGKGGKSISSESFPGGLKVKNWDFDSFQNRISFNFEGDSILEVYGISLESRKGVYMDNVPMRGASGTFFRSVDSTLLHHSLSTLNTRMVIMEFGGNVLPVIHSKKRADWYGNKMYQQIMRVKNTRPEASIIFIGPADMTSYTNGVAHTHNHLEEVRDALKRAALKAGVVYWDMYQAMGGKNSMQVWRYNKPSLASSDGIHFTKKGAQRISRMFYETLLNDYKIYRMRQRLEALENEG